MGLTPVFEGENQSNLLLEIRNSARDVFTDSYRRKQVPEEGVFHDILHTAKVVETSDAIISSPELSGLFEIDSELERYNASIDSITDEQIQRSSYLPEIQAQLIARQNELKISREELKDLFAISFYFHDIENWVLASEIGRMQPLDLRAEERASRVASEFINHYLSDRFQGIMPPDMAVLIRKYTHFAKYVIESTDLQSDSRELDPQNPKPFARFIKFCDRVGPYMNLTHEEVYNLALGLCNEKASMRNSIARRRNREQRLMVPFVLNFPHKEGSRIMDQPNDKKFDQILQGFKSVGMHLYEPFKAIEEMEESKREYNWVDLAVILSYPNFKQHVLTAQTRTSVTGIY